MAKSFDDVEYPVDGKEEDTCGLDAVKFEEAEKIATEEPVLAFPCRYEHLHFDAGLTHMDGSTALKYVRSRHSEQDGGDFGRAARQQRFLEAVKQKVLSVGFIPKILPLMDELDENMRTDIPLEVLQKLLKEASRGDEYKIDSMVLSDKKYIMESFSSDRQYILISTGGIDRWENVHKWVQTTLNPPTPTLSPIKK